MVESYDFKVIKSGKEVEVYDYKDKEILKGYKRRKRKEKKKDKPFSGQMNFRVYQQEQKRVEEEVAKRKIKTRFSISRTRTNIRRLVNSNPDLNQFLTLTFGKSTTELKKANYLFNQAMKRIIRRKDYFEYIAIVEFQKDVDYFGRIKPEGGSVHYHLLCNLEMPDFKSIAEQYKWEQWFDFRFWKNGFVKIKPVTQVDNLGAYFCKYLGKDMFDKRMFGKKKFFTSQSLEKPVELIGYKASLFHERYLSGLEPVYQRTFENEHAGTIDYSAYTLEEDTPVIFDIENQNDNQRKTRFGISDFISKKIQREN